MRATQRRQLRFQSTPLIRGETSVCMWTSDQRGHFNPLPSYEGRRGGDDGGDDDRFEHFNPLPSYEGRPQARAGAAWSKPFQSTPLIRGETSEAIRTARALIDFNPLPSYEGRRDPRARRRSGRAISIHSPHTRGDTIPRPQTCKGRYFNPLPSYEGRRYTKSC